ncbi:MAG: PIN domain-containing protein [Candidatus Jettenia caeni]|nr:MAG: PIN domain-containing protein [Candidatus Jettenia caeni]
MNVFIDTSAFLAVLDADDSEHERAKKAWEYLIVNNEIMICNNYILIETFTLIQRRLGMEAVRAFQEDVYPLLKTVWIDESDHRAGVAAVLTASRRGLSLVDCVSFEVMRRLGINKAFCFDSHFKEQGFECFFAK